MSQPISLCRKQLINSGSAQINSKLNSSNSLYRLYFSQCCIKTFFFHVFLCFLQLTVKYVNFHISKIFIHLDVYWDPIY